MNLDEEIRKTISEIEFDVPIFETYAFGIVLWIWKKPELYAEVVETEPYKLDGEYPMIMIKVAWFEISFDNKRLYRFIYKRKYGREPRGL